ncbi:MAG: hypothetical protein ACREFC_15130 [Stellaceae bacterium]
MTKAVRLVLLIVGVLAVIFGVVWIGQGTGHFPYPKSSFMIDQMPWAWRGGVLAVIGLIAVFVSRRV